MKPLKHTTPTWACDPPVARVPLRRVRDRQIRNKYRLFTLFCLLVIAIGCYFRIAQLDRLPGINGDEAWYGVQAQRFVDQYLCGIPAGPGEEVGFRTPTGNFWNPLFMGPRIVLEMTGAPSLWKLRAPAAVCGLITLAINWWLCRRATNRSVAWTTTLILAVMPVMIAYSRLAWDSCQSVLFCLPALYLPMIGMKSGKPSRYLGWTIICASCAVLVHPTNLFIAPIVLWQCWPLMNREWERRDIWLVALGLGFILPALILTYKAWQLIGMYPELAWNEITVWKMVLTNPLGSFCRTMIGLFTGEAIYLDISQTRLGFSSFLLLVAGLFTLWRVVHYLLINAPDNRPTATQPDCDVFAAWYQPGLYAFCQRILYGTILSLLPFYCMASQYFIEPGYVRYALWLIAPATIILGVVFANTSKHKPWENCLFLGCKWSAAVLVLGLFYIHFWRQFQPDGDPQGIRHITYLTGEIDPRAACWRELLAKLEPGEKPHILYSDTEDSWWYIWTLKYLSHRQASWENYTPTQQVKTPVRKESRQAVYARPDQTVWWLSEEATASGGPAKRYEWLRVTRPSQKKSDK